MPKPTSTRSSRYVYSSTLSRLFLNTFANCIVASVLIGTRINNSSTRPFCSPVSPVAFQGHLCSNTRGSGSTQSLCRPNEQTDGKYLLFVLVSISNYEPLETRRRKKTISCPFCSSGQPMTSSASLASLPRAKLFGGRHDNENKFRLRSTSHPLTSSSVSSVLFYTTRVCKGSARASSWAHGHPWTAAIDGYAMDRQRQATTWTQSESGRYLEGVLFIGSALEKCHTHHGCQHNIDCQLLVSPVYHLQ